MPWVTKWSGEALSLEFTHTRRAADGTIGLAYLDGTPYDVRNGVLWQRDGIAPGSGEPLWALVHTGRQRLAMTRLRCQVCGTPTAAAGTAVPWLLPADEYTRVDTESGLLTGAPPTCRACWPIARSSCPHLRRHGSVGCTVESSVVWGVYGQVFWPGTAEPPEPRLVPLALAGRIPILAQQMLVTLTGVTHVET